MWGVIATWEMAAEGVHLASEKLKNGASAADALQVAIEDVENNPEFQSVGFGGLPNEAGIVEMDAAFMNGNTFAVGAVAGITDVKNPIAVARKLSSETFNSFLVGAGATAYAKNNNFKMQNMLTDDAAKKWQERVKEVAKNNLSPYDGHDTVGVVTLSGDAMTCGTSTSGLFMKKPGRVGDSPLAGSGFYVDSQVGGACATGLGEDLMKGVLSFAIVEKMRAGLTPQEACDTVVYDFSEKLAKAYGKSGAMSLIAMDHQGNWGVATNVEFTFCVATKNLAPTVYLANPGANGTTVIQAITTK